LSQKRNQISSYHTIVATLSFVWVLALFSSVSSFPQSGNQRPRWTEQAADDWYAKQPWLVGSNYIPSYAINQLEMWQPDTFDPKRIDQELGWAESIRFNTMRVFLHDLLWEQDPEGFKKRVDIFLTICSQHHIRPIFVLFDSVWDANPHLGKQHPPRPGVHNSGWVQSPGAKALADPAQYPRLAAYVKGIVGAFGKDNRVLAWDLWNEPDNTNDGSYGDQEPKNKVAIVLSLLPQVYEWAREAGASQPLTSGVWNGNWGQGEKLSPMEQIQLGQSDIVSFHSYEKPPVFEQRILSLRHFNRPIICTEYMARSNGSTFQGSLPIAKKYHVGAINWGFVKGKTQTNYPWDSWQHPYIDHQPAVWFHDIFQEDGQPYRPEEVRFIREIIGVRRAG
jgi:Cellulase (glycosyl hydrolase family 5)